jgi:hypothetical protein
MVRGQGVQNIRRAGSYLVAELMRRSLLCIDI